MAKRIKFSGSDIITAISGTAALICSYFILLVMLSWVFPLELDIEFSTTIVSSNNQLLHSFLSPDDKWRMYTELDEITPELKKAIVFKEDKYFYYHFGINPVSIVRATLNNLKKKRRTSGASTITMQVARLLKPKERTYTNKAIEVFRAFQLELLLTKDEILQLYLNLVPYGGNIEGVKSASVIYFGKMPNHLSIGEITTLAIIPNRPVSLRLGSNNEYIANQRNKWLRRFLKAKLFDEEYILDALEEPVRAYRRSVPRLAPQLSYRLKSRYPNKRIIKASIDLEIQRKAEKLVANYSKRLYFTNIKNATALIIDNKSRKVLAYIGSADFFNDEDGGQVDGIKAIRSPGSTLKPLLYGIAFDNGRATPKTIISDVPVSFSGYEPENYDEKFNGNITIETALANSLNVPAVKMVNEIMVSTLTNKLIDANFRQIKKDKEDLGLSTILGGCGVNLEELSALYCSFANKGIYSPLIYLNDQKPGTQKPILTASAAFMVTEILTQLKRPDLPVHWQNSKHTPKIAWKTGTSYGRRDAWSIGYNNNYTIGVWVGNFSGEGVPELSGAEKATPLLFQLFNAIDFNTDKEWFSMPEELELRYVCSASGRIPGEYCEDHIIDYYIPGISDMRECDHLQSIFIHPDSTLSYCTACKPDIGYAKALYPNLSPEIISFYDENTIPYKKIPTHNPHCERMLAGSKPHITSPIHENDYYVNVKDSMEIMLSCQVANDVENVYWYINKKYLGSVKADEKLFFKPNEGKVEISCSDDKGRNSDIVIYVKYSSF